MIRIFINGVNSKAGGGKSILNNYLALLKQNDLDYYYYILRPKKEDYLKYSCNTIDRLDIQDFYNKNLLFPILIKFVLPKLIKELKIDVIFNLGDVVIPSRAKQVYLFDWSYAVYPESIVWNRMDIQSYVTRKIKLQFFKSYLRHSSIIIAQSDTMRDRLKAIYDLKSIAVIPNAVSLDNMTGGEFFDFNLPADRLKLLYLTYYYPHKNIEIFFPLAKRIKEFNLPYCIVITIEASQHRKAKQFLDKVSTEGLNDVIINIGPVSMPNVPSLYAQCDALLMPTLLESFSGTYVEAMYHGKPILTSHYDFASDVCGDSAFYFDPLNCESILTAIQLMESDVNLRNQRIEEGKIQLKRLLTWPQAFKKYNELMGINTV